MRTGNLVILGRNDNRFGLYNGTRAIVTAINVETDSLTLRTDDDREVKITPTWAARHDLSHAYAMTLHKAQGLTVDHALLYGSDALTREAGYVGLSRGRRENHSYLSPTTRVCGRTGECDFDQPGPLADLSSRSPPLLAGCAPAAAINSRATSNPAAGHGPDRTTNHPAPEWKAAADDRAPSPTPVQQ